MQQAVIGSAKDYIIYVDFSIEKITVNRNGKVRAQESVKGIRDFTQKAKQLAFGWGQFPNDGDEVIYLYDKGDENFGYAVNLDDPQCSEWGYAPF